MRSFLKYTGLILAFLAGLLFLKQVYPELRG